MPFVPYFDMGERILTDLRAVGIRGKLQSLEGPAFRAKVGQGRKGFPGNRTIVQNIDPRPGGAKANIGVYAVCGSPSSIVCEPQIEELWAKHEASTKPEERDRLIKVIQRILIEDYHFVPDLLESLRARRGTEGAPGRQGDRALLGNPARPLSVAVGDLGSTGGSLSVLVRRR